MRKIICRFANQTDLDVFNKQNGLSLTKDVKESELIQLSIDEQEN